MRNKQTLALLMLATFFFVASSSISFSADSIPVYSSTLGPYGVNTEECLTYFFNGSRVFEGKCDGSVTPTELRQTDIGASKICIGPPRSDFRNCLTFKSAGELVANQNPTIYWRGIPIWVP